MPSVYTSICYWCNEIYITDDINWFILLLEYKKCLNPCDLTEVEFCFFYSLHSFIAPRMFDQDRL